MELISRDEVMRLAESGKLLSGSFGERAKDIINSLPTIEERKEGHWIPCKWYFGKDKKSWTDEVKCSECGELGEEEWNCCPYCTAIMKGRNDG